MGALLGSSVSRILITASSLTGLYHFDLVDFVPSAIGDQVPKRSAAFAGSSCKLERVGTHLL